MDRFTPFAIIVFLFLLTISAITVSAALLTTTGLRQTNTIVPLSPASNTSVNDTFNKTLTLTTLPLADVAPNSGHQAPNIVVLHGPFVYLVTDDIIRDKVTILAFDTGKQKIVGSMTPKNGVKYIALSPDGATLYAIADTRTTGTDEYGQPEYTNHMWLTAIDTTSFSEKWSYELGQDIGPWGLAVSPDGRVYVSWQTMYSDKPGFDVYDFAANKHWSKAFDNADSEDTVNSFAFGTYGSQVYMSTYSEYGKAYKLDWVRNEFWTVYFSGDDNAASGVAMSPKSSRFYVGQWGTGDNGATMQTVDVNDLSKLLWPTGYRTDDLITSLDGDSLYVLSRSMDYNTQMLHRYSGLSYTPSAMPLTQDIGIPNSFYDGEQSATMSLADKMAGWRMATTADGNYLYMVVGALPYGDDKADELRVYDAHTLQFISSTTIPYLTGNLAIGPKPIRWNWTDTLSLPQGAKGLQPADGYFLSLLDKQAPQRRALNPSLVLNITGNASGNGSGAGNNSNGTLVFGFPKLVGTFTIPLPANLSNDSQNQGPPEEQGTGNQGSSGSGAGGGSSGTGSSGSGTGNQGIQNGAGRKPNVAVNPELNPQPEPPAPGSDAANAGAENAQNPQNAGANGQQTPEEHVGFFGSIAQFFARLFGFGK